jgi:long-chain fatty acid transport protein
MTRGVLAAGFQTLEQGTWDMGRAVTGAASAADSAATVFYNPAGMTYFDQPEIVGGLMGILVKSEFDLDPATTFAGSEGGNSGSNAVAPSGPFFVYPLNEDWAVGFSLTAPFVGSLDYGSNWAGRYMVREIDLASYRFGPSAAYQVNDWLSLGATVALNYTNLGLKTAIPTPGADGSLKIEDADEWELSFGLSAMLELREGTRLGISYFSEVDNDDLGGDIEVALPGPLPGFSSSVDVGLKLPQAVAASLRQEVTDKLVLFFDAGWADFSEFSYVSLDISGGTTIEASTHFKDTVALGFGAEYEVNPEWTLAAGISWASSPVSNKDRHPSLPFDYQVRYGAGFRYQWREDVTAALSYEFLDLGEAETNRTFAGGRLAGKYDPNYAHFIAFTLRKKF